MLAAFSKAGLDLDSMGDQLQQEGAESFSKSWRALLDCIGDKRDAGAKN